MMTTPDNKAIEKVSNFMRSDLVKARFAEAVGDRFAGAYISSVLLAVANDESGKLAACKPESIYVAALRAATLRLTVDPGLGQAYLVPFGGRATLIVGYKGLYDMAVRTGRYRYINVNPIYAGEIIEENRITGLHTLSGARTSKKIIGWLGAFEMNPARGQVYGLAKTMYMTVEEIHEHAQKYSKSYDSPKSGWKTDTAAMERKTVLRLLLRKWGYLDPADVVMLTEIESDPDSIDIELDDVQEIHKEPARSEAEIMTEIGQGDAAISDADWDKYLALCIRADAMSINYDNSPRDTWKNSEMARVYVELKNLVENAEMQKKI
jgi:recombination protein RecT